jgi:ABC-type multidrug transport system fused ATPase/permease subunit
MALRLLLPLTLGRFADDALAGASASHLARLAGVYVVIALVTALADLVTVWWSARVSWRAGNRLRERLAAHALRLEQAWHARHSPGQLIERIDGDVESMALFFADIAVRATGNAVLIVGMLVVATLIDPWTGLALTATAVVGAAVMVRLRLAAVSAREAEREANAVLYGDLEERLGGLEDLRANGAGDYAVHRLHAHSARSWAAARHASLRGDSAYAIAAIVFAVGSAVTLGAGILLQQRGAITVGAVLALYRYGDMLRRPLEQIAEQFKEFQKAMAGARRASTLLATEPAVVDGPDDGSGLPAGPLAVDLDGVTFSYDGRRAAVAGLDLHLAPGTHLGVVGRTGSGKTTVGRLLTRFWDADSGAVRVGGVDVRELQVAALRRRVAVVTEDVDLRAVLDRVGLGPWTASLPDGLDTPIEGGGGLSAGEGQLVAFARAFLADPDLVVLDEASSRLDPDTEARIGAAMRSLLDGRTAVVIAHRLDTLAEMDEIAVLDRGHMVEHGSRPALAARPGGHYARLLLASGSTGLVPDEATA